METGLTRRSFLRFFLFGGFISLFLKKFRTGPREKEAMFWRKKNET